ncbi:signal peptide peptidase SppA, partial [Odoribacter sp. OttesenSCG-928-J03]|nr:signal peptide peptidase SppA [Odoribacter sp. OttesenSCG-928-J03]
SAEEEVKLGLFDGAIYEDQMIDILKTRCGLKADDKLPYITFEKYLKAEVEGTKKASTKDKIAVIYASGEIGMKQSGVAIGPELAETIRNARKDKNVKAIVLRINSPGGSALTSDIIWREVKLAAEAKPFIASMGNVAASGGYYIACAADTIIADPTTLTGSIGVFGLLFSGEKLIKETIGVTTDGVKTNKYSDFGGSFPLPLPVSSRAFTAYERSVMQRSVEQTYETFLSRVTEGRGMSRDAVHEIAQGRVWTGTDALKLGLVDMLGGYNDAIRLAAEKAGLENYKIAEYPAEKNPFDEIFSGLTASIKTRILKEELGVYYDTYNFIKEMTQASEGVVARIPYNITIE